MNKKEIIAQIEKIQLELNNLKELLQDQERPTTTIYCHLLPNNKYYIGQAQRSRQRWQDGEGYKTNKPFYEDIQKYGWQNIKHIVICKAPLRKADGIEKALIYLYEANNLKYGYNKRGVYGNGIDDRTEETTNLCKGILARNKNILNLKELQKAYKSLK